MDRQQKERKILRKNITKLIGTLDLELKKKDGIDRNSVEATMSVLESQLLKLMELDETIKDDMLDNPIVTEEELDLEVESAQKYLLDVSELRVRVGGFLEPRLGKLGGSPNRSEAGSSYHRKTLKYPKITLKKYGGELKEWLGWWSQFSKLHNDDELDESDKFTYLKQAMEKGSKAEELVEGYPESKENYEKAVEALRNRYGKPKLLKQLYVRELISMIMSKTDGEKLALSSLYDRLESHLRCLESLGVTVEQMGVFLFPMVESSLPEEILMAWQRSPNYGVDGSTLDEPKSELNFLMDFLKMEIDNEEQRKLARSGFGFLQKKGSRKGKGFEEEDLPTAAGLFGGSSRVSCIFCEKAHPSKSCFKAQKMLISEKEAMIKKKGACFGCLDVGHVSKKCPAKVKCQLCSRRHQVLLCPLNPKNQELESGKKDEVNTTVSALNCTKEVILRTLMIRLENPSIPKAKMVRALLDCGSMRSYILKKTAQELELTPVHSHAMNHQVFGGGEVKNVTHQVYDVAVGSADGRTSQEVRVMDQAQICGVIPRAPKGPWIKELKKYGIFLNDLDVGRSAEIEFLVGADILGELLTGNLKRLKNGLTATETILGWTVMGEVSVPKEPNFALTVSSMLVTSATVEELWSLDVLGIQDPIEVSTQAEKDSLAQKHFSDTVKQTQSGRYSVSLPWVEEGMPIPKNCDVAYQRLVATTKKLLTLGKFDDYDSVFQGWESEGIISRVSSGDDGVKCHYLPHRAVIKESKTTPIRPVFDASCKIGRAPSLNGCLEKGPNLIELIPCILLRFRMGRIGVISDIRKAFQMIEVNEGDRDYLRFLWWEDNSQKKLVTFRHNRVVFGMNCSPFLLAAVLNFHVDGLQGRYPETAENFKNSLYVDNSVLSVDTPEQFQKFKEEAIEMLKLAGMELRQWEKTGDVLDKVTNVLGMKWNKVEDTLMIDPISFQPTGKVTVRNMLSCVHQIFDPLGLLSPVVIVPKLLIQRAWQNSRNWDEEVLWRVKSEFEGWWSELTPLLSTFSVPRRCTIGSKGNFQLHAFSDASKCAYAAVVFLRTEIDGEVEVQLLQSKSRVAPAKQATIPRLELMGCTISARLVRSVRSALGMEKVPTWFWSDSSTALSWIKTSDNWGTFVGNRVTEILRLTEPDQWNFVPGSLNPADLPSRGISPKKFSDSVWWEGPAWLKLGQGEWPSQKLEPNLEEVNKEKKKGVTVSLFFSAVESWFKRKDGHLVNVRIFAYVLRFVTRLKKGRVGETLDLSAEEMKNAEVYLFKLVQQEAFPNENYWIDGVCGIRGEDGVIRVRTKIINARDTPEFKAPILLPHGHPFVESFVREEHIFNCHGGAQFLMSHLREKVWIVKGRLTVKKVLRACVTCQRFTSKRVEVPTAALPEARVQSGSAFEVTGVDLAGPLTLRDETKVWIVIFTCAVYRAVHLELVSGLSTEEFVWAFIRFCRRKRRPAIVYSDRGTNFRGAVTAWGFIDWKEVKLRTQQLQIEWRLNPPSAPWWGGFWERLIRSLKDLLKRMLGFGKLNYQGFETALCEAEWVLNNRPLTFVTEDTEDLVPLTPAMFVHDLPTEDNLPEMESLTGATLGIKHKNLKVLLDELRNRFRKEYLGILIQRSQEKETKALSVGDLVFIGREDQKRILWPMGRVMELFPGKDGKIRVARLKTENGELIRPVQRLFPMEITQEESKMAGISWKPTGVTVPPDVDRGQEEVTNPMTEKRGQNEVVGDVPKKTDGKVVNVVKSPKKTRCGRTVKEPKLLDL